MADDAARVAQLEAELRELRALYAAAQADLEHRDHDLSESLEQQTATSEVLRVIAASPTALDAVLQAILSAGARLCDAESGLLLQRSGDRLLGRVTFGERMTNVWPEIRARGGQHTGISKGAITGRALLERRTIHVTDVPFAIEHEFPDSISSARVLGHLTQLTVPLLMKGEAIGVIALHRMAKRPFSDASDRAPGDVRRPGRHRHRERPAVLGAPAEQRRSPRRWSNRPPRPRCCESSPRRRPTYRVSSTPLPRAPLGCAMPLTRRFSGCARGRQPGPARVVRR